MNATGDVPRAPGNPGNPADLPADDVQREVGPDRDPDRPDRDDGGGDGQPFTLPSVYPGPYGEPIAVPPADEPADRPALPPGVRYAEYGHFTDPDTGDYVYTESFEYTEAGYRDLIGTLLALSRSGVNDYRHTPRRRADHGE